MTAQDKRRCFQELAQREDLCTGQKYADSLAEEPIRCGQHVRWTEDDEPGMITAITEHAIQIQWEASGLREWYSVWSGAVFDRIEPVTFSCKFKR